MWIVLDSVGIGAMPDAAAYGDPAGGDTLGNIARIRGLRLPNLARLGLGNIKPLDGIPPAPAPAGAFGRCALASPGKDTTTGHCEMAGIHLDRPFLGSPGNFTRTPNRHDYAVAPPRGMLLDRLEDGGVPVHSVGKISDVFLGRGIGESDKTRNNADGMAKTLAAMESSKDGLI